MRPSFHPRMVNGPFDDPALFIPFSHQNRAVLFDPGDIRALAPRDLLKISHVFVSHTHMDHFAGFDRLLRLLLGRQKRLHLFGPRGFHANIEGKLAGYTWNLVQNYDQGLVLTATEVHPDVTVTRCYACRDGFQPQTPDISRTRRSVLAEEPAFSVSAAILDHRIPCLGFALRERFHVNILADRLAESGLSVGPWLAEFKQALFSTDDWSQIFEIEASQPAASSRRHRLEDLADRIARITPGQKIAYIADVVYNPENRRQIVDLTRGADHLFIEAAFLEQDRDKAAAKHHLTARQAGHLAGLAGVKHFTLFHFSPRYRDCAQQLQREALEAYADARRI